MIWIVLCLILDWVLDLDLTLFQEKHFDNFYSVKGQIIQAFWSGSGFGISMLSFPNLCP